MRISDWSSDVCSSDLLAPILQRNVNERVLVFTEYRGTQAYIVEQLAQRYGDDKVHVVNGSMNVDERLRSIEFLEQHGQFLVSRSEERRVGKECVRTCRSRWSQKH